MGRDNNAVPRTPNMIARWIAGVVSACAAAATIYGLFANPKFAVLGFIGVVFGVVILALVSAAAKKAQAGKGTFYDRLVKVLVAFILLYFMGFCVAIFPELLNSFFPQPPVPKVVPPPPIEHLVINGRAVFDLPPYERIAYDVPADKEFVFQAYEFSSATDTKVELIQDLDGNQVVKRSAVARMSGAHQETDVVFAAGSVILLRSSTKGGTCDYELRGHLQPADSPYVRLPSGENAKVSRAFRDLRDLRGQVREALGKPALRPATSTLVAQQESALWGCKDDQLETTHLLFKYSGIARAQTYALELKIQSELTGGQPVAPNKELVEEVVTAARAILGNARTARRYWTALERRAGSSEGVRRAVADNWLVPALDTDSAVTALAAAAWATGGDATATQEASEALEYLMSEPRWRDLSAGYTGDPARNGVVGWLQSHTALSAGRAPRDPIMFTNWSATVAVPLGAAPTVEITGEPEIAGVGARFEGVRRSGLTVDEAVSKIRSECVPGEEVVIVGGGGENVQAAVIDLCRALEEPPVRWRHGGWIRCRVR